MIVNYVCGIGIPILLIVVILVLRPDKHIDRKIAQVKASQNKLKAKALLAKLKLREKESTGQELNTWPFGDYGGTTFIDSEKAASIALSGIVDTDLWRLIQEDDRIKLISNHRGDSSTIRTIFRIGQEDYVVHTYFDTGGR
jgi:hypothetical protein